MSYRVELSRLAERDLHRLPRVIAQRIRPRLFALAEDPRPRGSIKIGQPDRWRLRVVLGIIEHSTMLTIKPTT